MYTEKQKTLQRRATLSGIALHTGDRVNLTLLPAEPGHGVVFRRTDMPGRPDVRAVISNVSDTRRATTIRHGDAVVHTTEHLLAAMHALGVDNALVEMNGPEPPVADGSAVAFLEMIREAGIVEQNAPRLFCELKQPVSMENNGTVMIALPYPILKISAVVKFGENPMACQYLSIDVTPESFEVELAKARTFCLYHEIEPLMTANLIRGGSLDNSVVLKGNAILSRDGLRYADELVRHKILDIVGDLFLVGRRLRAHIVAVKSGHPSNVALARGIVESAGVF